MRSTILLAALALSTISLLGCHGAAPTGATSASSSAPADAKPATKLVEPGPDGRRPVGVNPGNVGRGTPLAPQPGHELAAFAGGCFWGTEDAFRQLPGVTATAVGYTGGHTDAPTYEDVCGHGTGHAETVLIEFDPQVISYEKLLRAFFQIHDPTTLNRQGPDYGDQYRSEIFTFSEAQARAARAAIDEAKPRFGDPIVTKIEPIGRFFKAEGYHQQYAERTGSHGCPTGRITDI